MSFIPVPRPASEVPVAAGGPGGAADVTGLLDEIDRHLVEAAQSHWRWENAVREKLLRVRELSQSAGGDAEDAAPVAVRDSRLLRPAEVMDRLSVSEATLWRMVRSGDLPEPTRLAPGGKAVGWPADEIDEWVADRRAEPEWATAGRVAGPAQPTTNTTETGDSE